MHCDYRYQNHKLRIDSRSFSIRFDFAKVMHFSVMICIHLPRFRIYLIHQPKHVTRYRLYRRHISILSARSKLNQIRHRKRPRCLARASSCHLPRRFQASLNTLRNLWGRLTDTVADRQQIDIVYRIFSEKSPLSF